MARNVYRISEHTTIFFGHDDMGAHGSFVQVCDKRFAAHESDEQGEGYVLDFDTLFGFTTNLIGATLDGLKQDTVIEYIQQLTEKFIASLPNSAKPSTI